MQTYMHIVASSRLSIEHDSSHQLFEHIYIAVEALLGSIMHMQLPSYNLYYHVKYLCLGNLFGILAAIIS
jgi:hypothetical protein